MTRTTCPCPSCGCTAPDRAHAVLAALREDDLDAALALGLLDLPHCASCREDCNAMLAAASQARQFALAARDRHRARALRLARIQSEREAARRPAQVNRLAPDPALPAAAADALARALARVKSRRG